MEEESERSLEKRVKRVQGERKRREERKKNIIIREVKAKKEVVEGFREEVEKIIKETEVVAKIKGLRQIGKRTRRAGKWCG